MKWCSSALYTQIFHAFIMAETYDSRDFMTTDRTAMQSISHLAVCDCVTWPNLARQLAMHKTTVILYLTDGAQPDILLGPCA